MLKFVFIVENYLIVDHVAADCLGYDYTEDIKVLGYLVRVPAWRLHKNRCCEILLWVSQRGQYHGTRRKLIFLFIMWKTVIIILYVYTQGRAYSTENRGPLERKSRCFKRSSIGKRGIGRPQIRCMNDQVKAAGLRWTQAICNRHLCGGLWPALDVLRVTRRWWW